MESFLLWGVLRQSASLWPVRSQPRHLPENDAAAEDDEVEAAGAPGFPPVLPPLPPLPPGVRHQQVVLSWPGFQHTSHGLPLPLPLSG